jgi:flagellar basal-body rod protein FlgC
MSLFAGIEICGSGLTAQRLRLDVIASNIANVETTRSGQFDPEGRPLPYRRRAVIFEAKGSPFSSLLEEKLQGVRVKGIVEDSRPFRLIYDPDHPDADEQGYVRMPNVNIIEEMVDLVSASRAYEANATVLSAIKEMSMRALEIGRR